MNYAGEIDCIDCFENIKSNPKAQLVDVRTTAEWDFVGVPDLADIGKKLIMVEWQSYHSMEINPDFTDTVISKLDAAGCGKDDPVYIICRSGVRSKSAAIALTELGYSKAYNVTQGFEGDRNSEHQRGKKEGWKFDDLPWGQS